MVSLAQVAAGFESLWEQVGEFIPVAEPKITQATVRSNAAGDIQAALKGVLFGQEPSPSTEPVSSQNKPLSCFARVFSEGPLPVEEFQACQSQINNAEFKDFK